MCKPGDVYFCPRNVSHARVLPSVVPRRPRCLAVLLRLSGPGLAAFASAVGFLLIGGVASASVAVTVFPVAGSRYNRPATQITFRGISPASIGAIEVVGSQTGAHTGHIAADSDGQGASFLPDQKFVSGETVTVTTRLNIVASRNGTFTFQVGQPWGLLPYGKLRLVAASRGSL